MPRHAAAVPFAARAIKLGGAVIPLPLIATTVLSLVAGALQVINQVVLKGHPEIQASIAVFLVFLVGIGITPETGAAFRNLIHLPPWANTLITAILSALVGVLQIASIGQTAHLIVATVLTVLAALGFGGSQGLLVPVARPATGGHGAAHPHTRA